MVDHNQTGLRTDRGNRFQNKTVKALSKQGQLYKIFFSHKRFKNEAVTSDGLKDLSLTEVQAGALMWQTSSVAQAQAAET